MGSAGAALDPETREFYVRTLTRLNEAGAPYLVGGAYALAVHAGVERHTKDLDINVIRRDLDRVLGTLERAGYRTEIPFPHWLAKAHHPGGHFVDVIFNSGNGQSPVDEGWFEHAVPGELLGVPVRIAPAEESLWVKAFIMERERFDGADVAHLLLARGPSLDWQRLLRRFGPHWRVLLAHLVLFGFIYPSERSRIPGWVLSELTGRLGAEPTEASGEGICRGTLLSREQYLKDIGPGGYRDARLPPGGGMSPGDVAHWTAAIGHGIGREGAR